MAVKGADAEEGADAEAVAPTLSPNLLLRPRQVEREIRIHSRPSRPPRVILLVDDHPVHVAVVEDLLHAHRRVELQVEIIAQGVRLKAEHLGESHCEGSGGRRAVRTWQHVDNDDHARLGLAPQNRQLAQPQLRGAHAQRGDEGALQLGGALDDALSERLELKAHPAGRERCELRRAHRRARRREHVVLDDPLEPEAEAAAFGAAELGDLVRLAGDAAREDGPLASSRRATTLAASTHAAALAPIGALCWRRAALVLQLPARARPAASGGAIPGDIVRGRGEGEGERRLAQPRAAIRREHWRLRP